MSNTAAIFALATIWGIIIGSAITNLAAGHAYNNLVNTCHQIEAEHKVALLSPPKL